MWWITSFLLVFSSSLLTGCTDESFCPPRIFEGNTMGTTYTVRISGFPDDESKRVDMARDIEEELRHLNRIFSTYDPDSEISRLNQTKQAAPIRASSDLLLVLEAARGLYESTGGLFDPTVAPLVSLWGFGPDPDRSTPPSSQEIKAVLPNVGFDKLQIGPADSVTKAIPGVQLDLSANAKGYAVDKIYELLTSRGFRDVLVEIGGEIRLGGHEQKGQPWRVGVASKVAIAGLLELDSGAVATSGVEWNSFGYHGVRYPHLINPLTGYPIQTSLLSVTILAPTCMQADGAATAVMLLGPYEGYRWISQQADTEALLLIEDGSGEGVRKMTPGFDSHLVYGSQLLRDNSKD